jgi:hypothetical protein
MERIVSVSPTLQQRYWKHVEVRGPDECWLWTACAKRGKGKLPYGQIWIGRDQHGKVVMGYAHRVAWELANGKLPDELHVRHRCDNPLCQNPNHLELGTHADNMRDMHERGRLVNVRGSKHGKSKLTEQKIRDMRAMHATGVTQCALAEMFEVTQANVSDIILRKTWKHVE